MQSLNLINPRFRRKAFSHDFFFAMHNNYFYLRQVSAVLAKKLNGWQLLTAFSQDKDELVFEFLQDQTTFFVRATLKPDFVCLTMPDTFNRARKNTVDLFAPAMGKTVTGVIQYENDRSFAIQLDTNFLLLFKLHGNRSNVLLYADNQPVELFQNNIENDWNLQPETLHRLMQPTFEDFLKANQNPAAVYPTLGKLAAEYLDQQGFADKTAEEKWQQLQQVLQRLMHPAKYYVTNLRNLPVLSLLPIGDIQAETIDPLEAANRFFGFYATVTALVRERGAVVQALEKRRKQTESYLDKSYRKLDELLTETRNEQIANIVMANMHQIPTGIESVELHDFYHDHPIRIKLKKELSAQKNAEVYYRKAKNEKIEVGVLEKTIAQKEKELAGINKHLEKIVSFTNVKPLRNYLKESNLAIEESTPQPENLFKKYEYMGYEILVGKNAKNNDLLTREYAWKEDLWLHAKDVSGSHVVIKYQSGRVFPEPVIERAAQLAAYYSKRKNDTLCPVTVTPRKYVRKPKGLPDGAVIVDKEKVVLVEPKL